MVTTMTASGLRIVGQQLPLHSVLLSAYTKVAGDHKLHDVLFVEPRFDVKVRALRGELDPKPWVEVRIVGGLMTVTESQGSTAARYRHYSIGPRIFLYGTVAPGGSLGRCASTTGTDGSSLAACSLLSHVTRTCNSGRCCNKELLRNCRGLWQQMYAP